MKLEYITKTKMQRVGGIKIPDIFFRRLKSGIDKMDQLFGGSINPGVLPGSSFTITGVGGTGKSCLMLQWLQAFSKQGYACAVASGEESIYQIALTAKRLDVTDVMVANISDIDAVAELTKQYDILIVDSFQSMHPSPAREKLGIKGARKVEKYCVETLCSAGKENECVIGFVMHHTKAGVMKGGTIVIHTVDANFEIWAPEPDIPTRWIETSLKNRFGPPWKFSAAFEATGYDFTVDIEESVDDELKRAGLSPTMGKAGVFEGKGARRASEIATLLENETLTLAQGAEIVGDMQRARFILSDLHLQGLFVKTGRGATALFTRTPAGTAKLKPVLQPKTEEAVNQVS